MTTKKPTLAEYAAEKAPPLCRVCVLPERAEIDENYRQGVPRRLIHEWMIEVRGYKPTGLIDGLSASALDSHLSKKHHLKEM